MVRCKGEKERETQETFLSVDNFDGYYSDNDNIGVTNTLEAEKKEYDRKNKQRDVISVKLGEEGLFRYVQAFMCICEFLHIASTFTL